MRVVIFAATGMVDKGVLLDCLDDARVERVLRPPQSAFQSAGVARCDLGRANSCFH
jgi:hypothetical protein